jgi:hypothetical protein
MPAKHRFKYSDFPADKAQQLRNIADTLDPLLKKLHSTALEAGQNLRAAKEIAGHGTFGSFCRDVMKTDPRMCQHYINIANLADEVGSDIVERMPASSAALLASAPPEIVTQIIGEMNDGRKCPSVRRLKERIQDAGSNEDSVATVHSDEPLPDVQLILIRKLEKRELAALVDFLNAANQSTIAALCAKIQSYLTFG